MKVTFGISHEWCRGAQVPDCKFFNSSVWQPCKVRDEFLGNENVRLLFSSVTSHQLNLFDSLQSRRGTPHAIAA